MDRALLLIAAASLLPVSALADDLAADVAAACRGKIPEKWRTEGGDELRGEAVEGRWEIHVGQMNGVGSAEAFVVVLPYRHKGEVHFVAERGEKEPKARKVKLDGHIAGYAAVSFHEYREDRRLAHVDATPAGQVLLHWDGGDLRTVWKVGKTRDDESHWFNLEDLDGDGTMEVIAFFRRELDVFYADEDDLDEQGGADRSSAGQIDAVAVYRLEKDNWKKDKQLLDTLR